MAKAALEVGWAVFKNTAGNFIARKITGKNIDDLIKQFGKSISRHITKKAADEAVKANMFKASRKATPQRTKKIETVAERQKRIREAREAKKVRDKKTKEDRAAKKAADKKRAEEKKAAAKKKAEEKAKKKRQQEAKEKRKQEQKEQKDIADVEAGTKVPVKGSGKSTYSRREATKPRGTETLVTRQKVSKDPKTGKLRGGQFPKRKEAGAPGSKTRRASEARVRARRDKKVLPWIIGGGAAGIGATGAIIAARDKDLPAGYGKGPRPAPDAVSVRAVGLPTGAAAARLRVQKKASEKAEKQPSEKKDPLTNDEIGRHFQRIEKLIVSQERGGGFDTVIYDGKEYDNWKEYDKAWRDKNKGRKRPEDPVKRVIKKIKKNITGKKGGGRVSSRPAKVMKQYVKGGSVRKPKRI